MSKPYDKYYSLIVSTKEFSKKDIDNILSAVYNRTKGSLTDEEVMSLQTLMGERLEQDYLPLTDDYKMQGLVWLRNLWRGKSGRERKHNPFGAREQATLETSNSLITIKIMGFYQCYPSRYYTPEYAVRDLHPTTKEVEGGFDYMVNWREAPETGCYICG